MAAYAIQFRRGTTTQHNSFTGLLGEVTVDTDKSTVVVHDGSTAGGFALALEGAAVSTTTGAFTSNVTVDGSLTVSGGAAITGALTMTGHVLPSADVTYDLGSSTKQWKDIYVGPGSLYVNGKKVIEDDSGSINITTDNNEDLMMSTTGTGTIKLRSANGINLTGELGATSGDIQIGDHVDMNSSLIKELATPVSGTDAANKTYVDSAAASAVTGGSNAGAFTNVTVSGDLTVTGTTTTINATNVNIGDNIIALNADATGSPTENAGIDVERGDSLNVQLLWDETNDRWTVGSEDMVAATFIGALTGNVTGTVSSLTNHVLDEDNMATDSATKVPTQQSVKAYVDSQVATIDNTDEMTEGSTNLYFTNARARSAISVSGDISYNSTTGVISTTGLASSDTDDLSEGSSNLYYTNARADARIAAVLVDSDSMAGHSATSLASGESIKAYVDAADTAQTTSINTAWAAADTAQTTALQTYADTAEADAISTAASDATTKANAAQAAAIADSDAENLTQTAANKLVWEAYADQAEADAISTAAADATSKADAAEADAISTAAADATSKANAAQAAAIADSDAENTAQTAANKLLWEAYADQAEADAESAAAADATTKANAAQAAAIAAAATDATTKVNVLTAGASASLDTLLEIANVMATDAELSSAIGALNHDSLSGFVANEHIDWTADQGGTNIHAGNYTNTTYSVTDGQLSEINFTSADHSKLNGIASGATNVTNNNQLTNGAGYITGYTNTTYTAGNGLGLSGTEFSMDGQYTGDFTVSGDITAQGGDMTATRFNGEATTAKYADLAERYAADASYEEGTVVMFGGEAEVTAAQGYGSTKIAGVVSTKPGFAMNAEAGNSETHPYIALQGRVPCKVTGTVSKGDILVASEVSGVATVWTESTTDPRMTAYVGIAIEDKTSETTDYIEVKVGK